jgi:transposase
MSNKPNRFSPEVRERAMRMVQDQRGEYAPLWAAIEPIAPKIGCVPQTLQEWVRKQESDAGLRDGTTS